MMKRILSLLLALTMVVGMLPMTALAEDTETVETEAVTEVTEAPAEETEAEPSEEETAAPEEEAPAEETEPEEEPVPEETAAPAEVPAEPQSDDAAAALIVNIADCTEIGNSDGDPVLLVETAIAEDVTQVSFADLEGMMEEEGMIAAINSNFYVEGTHIAPLSAAYRMEEPKEDWVLMDDYAGYDFDGCYCYWIMDDDYNMYYVVIKNTAGTPVDPPAPVRPPVPTVKAKGNEAANYTVTENGYSYTNYLGVTATVDLYTFTLPRGSVEVELSFGMNVLAYNYAGANCTDDDFIGKMVEDYMTGASVYTLPVDANEDGKVDYIQVQTPYDASWNSELLYAVTFVVPEPVPVPEVIVNGVPVTDFTVTEGGYSYTNYLGVKTTVDLYTFVVPYGTGCADLNFGMNVLAYNYAGADCTDDDFIGKMVEDYMTGDAAYTLPLDANGDGKVDYIQVQTPYDASWNSELLYAVTFEKATRPVVFEDGTMNLSFESCTVIGDSDGDPVYFVSAEVPDSVNQVAFVDLADCMGEDSMIASLGNAYVEGTHVAPLSADYRMEEPDEDWQLKDEYADQDFTDCYAYWITDDDFNMYYVILQDADGIPEAPAVEYPVPAVSVNGVPVSAFSVAKTAYTYTNYTGKKATVDLYTFVLPYGTEAADFSFGMNVLAYNYASVNSTDDDYLDGMVEDFYTGFDACTVKVDSNNDGKADYIQVQTPYDASWNSELLYAVTFEVAAAPEIKASGYTLTAEPTGKTFTYSAYSGVTYEVPLLECRLPYGTVEAELSFGRNVLAYNYAAPDEYLAGWVEDFMTGSDTCTVQVDSNGDGKPDFVQVQTPYDAAWNSDLLYAVTFTYDELPTASVMGMNTTAASVFENAYSYTDWQNNTTTVDVLTIPVPFGIESVTLTFPRNVLAYNYAGAECTDDDFITGLVEDYMTGASRYTVSVDANKDGQMDYIQVQSPYDAAWNTTVLYAITFVPSGMTVPGGNKLTLTAPAELGEVNWSLRTQDAAFASVSAKGVLTTKTVSQPTLVVAAAVSKADPAAKETIFVTLLPTVYRVRIFCESFDINSHEIPVALKPGASETLKLYAVADPYTASVKGTWKSSDPKVAAVDADGVVTVKKAGNVKITFTVADSAKASDTITIKAGIPAVVTLQETAEVVSGKKITLKASVNADATVKGLTWSSSNPDAASVSSKGVVTAKTVYEETVVTISAISTDGRNSSASCEVTVKPKAGIFGIQLNEEYVNGKTVTVDIREPAVLAGPDGTEWSVSSAKIAAVDETGAVTFKKAGTVTVTAKYVGEDGKKTTAKVTLKGVRKADELTVTAASDAALVSGKGSVVLTANIDPNATERSVTWHGGDGVVKITSTGKNTAKVTALKGIYTRRTVFVFAEMKDGSGIRSEMLCLEVVPAAETVVVNTVNQLPMVGGTAAAGEAVSGRTLTVDIECAAAFQLNAVLGTRFEASEISQDVTWKTSSKKIAEVDEEGNVTVKGTGSVTITATARDGSKKAASVKLKVVRLAKSIEVAAAAPLVSGKSVTLKPVLKPAVEGAKLTSKAVTFSLRDADKEFASVNSKGVVTAKKGLTEEHKIVVTVALKDDPSVSVDVEITVVPKN